MDAARAFQTYSILTVGDGLVSQIPGVIISVAAALLLSRGGAEVRRMCRSLRNWAAIRRRYPQLPA